MATPAQPYPNISHMPPAVGGPVTPPPNVSYMLPEVAEMKTKWDLIADCMAGQEAVKKKATLYLPRPNPEDETPANDARYRNYLARAVFYNVVANTVSGLVGQVFNSDPVSEYPPELEPLWYDATGTGVTLIQQARKAMTANLSMGRCGLLVDFPRSPSDENGNTRPFTRKEVMDGIARPTIQYYGCYDIINWRFEPRGAVSVCTLVVLVEDYIIQDDGFELKRGKECRVLKLVNGTYTVEIWRRKDEKQEGPYELVETATPTDASGAPLSYIPFFFIGSQNNDAQVDRPPMYDMACINIAHYRNSADYEDSVFMVGQPTPYFSGLTEKWVNDVLKGTVHLGSRGAVPLPPNGEMGLVQAEPNSMVKEAMDQKQQQMVALGAQLVQDQQVQRTLGEAKMETTVVVSTLTTCARNVSQAVEAALIAAATFTNANVNKDAVIFQLSTDFAIQKLEPQERQQLLSEWQGGLLSFTEARAQLRQSGIASLDDAVARSEIDQEQEAQLDLDVKRNEALADTADDGAQE